MDECPICYEDNIEFITTRCKHTTCIVCYRNWMKEQQTCPLCRRSIRRLKNMYRNFDFYYFIIYTMLLVILFVLVIYFAFLNSCPICPKCAICSKCIFF